MTAVVFSQALLGHSFLAMVRNNPVERHFITDGKLKAISDNHLRYRPKSPTLRVSTLSSHRKQFVPPRAVDDFVTSLRPLLSDHSAMSRSVEFSRSALDLRQLLDFEMAKRSLPSSAEWYTEPIHYTPRHSRCSSPLRPPSPSGPSPVRLEPTVSERLHGQSVESFAAEYFPTTLSAPYTLMSTPKPSRALSPEPKGLPEPSELWRPLVTPVRKKVLMKYPKTPLQKPPTQVDKLYAMAAEMPATAASTVALSTPYQLDLAKLRLQRLRIEEDHLLEVKRLEELERIRGPKPKWYEMKSPDFHYENHKNTELVKRWNGYQSLFDYRMRLVKASQEFEMKNAFA